jgi:hypothetical protein
MDGRFPAAPVFFRGVFPLAPIVICRCQRLTE